MKLRARLTAVIAAALVFGGPAALLDGHRAAGPHAASSPSAHVDVPPVPSHVRPQVVAHPPTTRTAVRPTPAPSGPSLLDAPAHGRTAVAALGPDGVDVAAARNHTSPAALKRLLRTDHTAWVDRQARVYYVDRAASASTAASAAPPPSAPYPASQTFSLHSSPGSRRTIFLDFDGDTVTGSSWNDATLGSSFSVAGLDEDGAPGFDDEELAMVQEIWRQVSEDYAPFDVDVTTQDPGPDALRRTSSADRVYGTKVDFTGDDAVEQHLCQSDCGGIAYVDVFDEVSTTGAGQPAWVFTDLNGYDTDYLAAAASHEVGHNFGLHHDGDASGQYSKGHGAWIPLMGGGIVRMSEWSKGEYAGATNTEDDVAIIGRASGAPLRADDHGDSTSTATALGTNPATTVHGLISTRTDRDDFALTLGCTGRLSAAATGIGRGADLDISLRLLDASGHPLATVDPPVQPQLPLVKGLDASLAVDEPPGTYYLEVDGTGFGDPMTTGYTDYGSLGRYTLDVSGCVGVPASPTSLGVSTGVDQRSATLSWAPPAYDGSHPVTGYVVSSSGDPATAPVVLPADATSYTFSGLRPGSTYSFWVSARNDLGSSAPAGRSVVLPGMVAIPVRDLRAAPDVGSSSVTLTWAPPAGDGGLSVTGYRVARTGPGSSHREWTVDAGTRSVVDDGLAPGSDLSYTVWALNDGGQSASAGLVAHLAAPQPSGPPSGVGFRAGNGRIAVSWSPPVEAGTFPVTGYDVAWSPTGGAARTVRLPVGSRAYTVTGLTNGTAYHVRVLAVTAAGNGTAVSSSALVPATTPGRTRVTRARSGSPGGRVTADVAWAAASTGGSPVTGYRVTALRMDAAGRVVGRTTLTRLGRARTASMVLPRRARYRFTVQAVNRLGAGPVSARSSAVDGR